MALAQSERNDLVFAAQNRQDKNRNPDRTLEERFVAIREFPALLHCPSSKVVLNDGRASAELGKIFAVSEWKRKLISPWLVSRLMLLLASDHCVVFIGVYDEWPDCIKPLTCLSAY